MSDRVENVLVSLGATAHIAEEGGFWAEVESMPGCASQGETLQELLTNIRDAIDGCMATSA